jgi:glycosidase
MKRLKFFEKDPLNWMAAPEKQDFYSRLLQLHSSNPALRAADPTAQTFRISTSADKYVFAYLRKKGNKEVLVLLNLSPENKLRFDLLDSRVSGTFRSIFSNAANDFTIEKSFEMQGWEYLVYEK